MNEPCPIILCVDDQEDALILRKEILQRSGYSVLTARTISEALDVIQSTSVSLVVADHMLKGENGPELAARIKALNRNVPILMISGAMPETMTNIDCFILKTEPVNQVLAMIRELVERAAK